MFRKESMGRLKLWLCKDRRAKQELNLIVQSSTIHRAEFVYCLNLTQHSLKDKLALFTYVPIFSSNNKKKPRKHFLFFSLKASFLRLNKQTNKQNHTTVANQN